MTSVRFYCIIVKRHRKRIYMNLRMHWMLAVSNFIHVLFSTWRVRLDGRGRMTGNHVYPKGYPGFESLTLRQTRKNRAFCGFLDAPFYLFCQSQARILLKDPITSSGETKQTNSQIILSIRFLKRSGDNPSVFLNLASSKPRTSPISRPRSGPCTFSNFSFSIHSSISLNRKILLSLLSRSFYLLDLADHKFQYFFRSFIYFQKPIYLSAYSPVTSRVFYLCFCGSIFSTQALVNS